jgi:hypothetical protein
MGLIKISSVDCLRELQLPDSGPHKTIEIELFNKNAVTSFKDFNGIEKTVHPAFKRLSLAQLPNSFTQLLRVDLIQRPNEFFDTRQRDSCDKPSLWIEINRNNNHKAAILLGDHTIVAWNSVYRFYRSGLKPKNETLLQSMVKHLLGFVFNTRNLKRYPENVQLEISKLRKNNQYSLFVAVIRNMKGSLNINGLPYCQIAFSGETKEEIQSSIKYSRCLKSRVDSLSLRQLPIGADVKCSYPSISADDRYKERACVD